MDKADRELLAAYLTKAGSKLDSARRLLEDEDYENSISRAYYAAFHATQALLLSEGLTPKTHHGLVSLFGLHFVKTGKIDKKYAEYLSNLRDDRESSDYDAFSLVDRDKAEMAFEEAQAFVDELRRYLAPHL